VRAVGGRSGRRRRAGAARRVTLAAAAAAVLLGLAWILVTGLLARRELERVRAGVPRLRALISEGNVAGARGEADELRGSAHRAHLLTTGPAWYAAAAIPYLGDPLDTVRGVTASVDDLGRTVLPGLAGVADRVNPRTLLTAGDRIDVDLLATAAPALGTAAADVAGARAAVAALPAHTWLAPADGARSALLGQLGDLHAALAGADQTARILPAMLGRHGPRRVFIGVQNEAESRGTGGLPGAFAIAVASRGRITLTRFENDSTLFGVSTGLDFGPDYRNRYAGADSTNFYGNSNISPHFPYAARIWAAMWQRRSGQRIDATVALDPTALSYLLAVTGPARLADGTELGAGNIVALTQQAEYARFADDTARKAYLLEVARAAVTRLLGRHGDPAGLVRALARAAGERRLLVWSADPAVQGLLEQTPVAGTVPAGDGPYSGLVVVNAAGNKLDYYLDRSLHYRRTGCGDTRTVTATIQLTNTAPRSGLPAIVTGRNDRPRYPTRPGDNRLLVSYYATRGARLLAATLDGTPTTVSPQRENGHPVYTLAVETPVARRRTLVLTLTEPAAAGPLTVLRQPLVRPLRVSTTDTGCR